MLARLARTVIRRRKARAPVASVLLFAVSGAFGGGVAEDLSSGGFGDPASESFQADDALLDTFGAGTPTCPRGHRRRRRHVDDPAWRPPAGAHRGAGRRGPLHQRRVVLEPRRRRRRSRAVTATEPWCSARIEGDQNEVNHRVEELADYQRQGDGITRGGDRLRPGVQRGRHHDRGGPVRAESIALPDHPRAPAPGLRHVVSASLPLAIGALSVVGTLAVLRLINMVTEVSIFSLNLTTAMGLGLAIDYSLFVVSRFREELHAGHEPHVAVQRTVQTAGRTVAFSAVTVAASLCALLVFPLAFLRSFAYAGVAVAFLAGAFSVVVLPAILAALGPGSTSSHLQALHPGPRRGVLAPHGDLRDAPADPRRGGRGRGPAVPRRAVPQHRPLAARRPGAPRVRAAAGRRPTCCATSSPRARPGRASVVARAIGDPTARTEEIGAFAATLAQLDGVARVDALTGSYCGEGMAAPRLPARPAGAARRLRPLPRVRHHRGRRSTYLTVVPDVEPLSAAGEDLARAIRARRGAVPRAGHRPVRPAGRHQGRPVRRLPLARGDHRARHVPRAVHPVRLGGHPDQGGRSSTCSACRPRSAPWSGSSRTATSATSWTSPPSARSTPPRRS